MDPPATIKSVKSDQGKSLPNHCYTGGLNGGVGAVQIKKACMKSSVPFYTVCFDIGGVDHCIKVVNPIALNWVDIDFGDLMTLQDSSGTFAVKAVNDADEVIENDSGTAWVTAIFEIEAPRLDKARSSIGL